MRLLCYLEHTDSFLTERPPIYAAISMGPARSKTSASDSCSPCDDTLMASSYSQRHLHLQLRAG